MLEGVNVEDPEWEISYKMPEDMKDTEWEDRLQWIKDLKVGNKIALGFVGMYNTHYSITYVSEITANGYTKIRDKEWLFDSDGYYGDYLIAPITQDVLDHIEKEKLIDELRCLRFDYLRLDQLRKIKAIVDDRT